MRQALATALAVLMFCAPSPALAAPRAVAPPRVIHPLSSLVLPPSSQPALAATAPPASAFPALTALREGVEQLPLAGLENKPLETSGALAGQLLDGLPSLPGPPEAVALPLPQAQPAPLARPQSSANPRVYLLPRPLESTAALGPVASALHYGLETGFQFVKGYCMFKAAGAYAAISFVIVELLKMPPMISLQSMADLQLRYWWRKLKDLKGLAGIPGVERIRVLTASETEFSGVLAKRQTNRGLIFLETSHPLPALETLAFGAPIEIDDLATTKMGLRLELNGRPSETSWTPSLQDLFDHKPIPPEVARAWRDDIARANRRKSWFKLFFDFAEEKGMKVTTFLIGPDGPHRPLGDLTQGHSTKKLLGITRWDQTSNAVRRFFGAAPIAGRSIPIGDTAVMPSDRAPALPKRLWQSFLGRLIVR